MQGFNEDLAFPRARWSWVLLALVLAGAAAPWPSSCARYRDYSKCLPPSSNEPAPAPGTFEALLQGVDQPLLLGGTYGMELRTDCMRRSSREWYVRQCMASQEDFRRKSRGATQVALAFADVLEVQSHSSGVITVTTTGWLGDIYYSGGVYLGDWGISKWHDDGQTMSRFHRPVISDGAPIMLDDKTMSLMQRTVKISRSIASSIDARYLALQAVVKLDSPWDFSEERSGPEWSQRIYRQPSHNAYPAWRAVAAKVMGFRLVDLSTGVVAYSEPPSQATIVASFSPPVDRTGIGPPQPRGEDLRLNGTFLSGTMPDERQIKGSIQVVLTQNAQVFHDCKAEHGFAGEMTMKWIIRPDGTAHSVEFYPTYRNPLGDSDMACCLAAAIRMLRFPRPNAELEVLQNFEF